MNRLSHYISRNCICKQQILPICGQIVRLARKSEKNLPIPSPALLRFLQVSGRMAENRSEYFFCSSRCAGYLIIIKALRIYELFTNSD